MRFHLGPLPLEDGVRYLEHRLKVAGHSGQGAFAEDAVALVHTLAHGVPREMNRLAKLALEHAWCVGSALVDSRHVNLVMGDLLHHRHPLVASSN